MNILGRSYSDIKKIAGALGGALDGPRRADEKAAAAVAWVTLPGRAGQAGRS